MSQEFLEFAVQYHQQMPLRIRQYLNGRGISGAVISRYVVGWSGWRITIPIYDRFGDVSFFKLAKDPADPGDSPDMLAAPDGAAELYGWEHVEQAVSQVVICEGEFDRLLLESLGYAAITSTAADRAFRREWARAVSAIPRVYVCFHRAAAGRAGAARVGRLIRHARIVGLPAQVGEGGGITEFFIGLNRSRARFDELLEDAKPLHLTRRGASRAAESERRLDA